MTQMLQVFRAKTCNALIAERPKLRYTAAAVPGLRSHGALMAHFGSGDIMRTDSSFWAVALVGALSAV
ncbi:MAG: hypothetical protein ACRD15_11675, partial [Vicinamibacterales bacterium]